MLLQLCKQCLLLRHLKTYTKINRFCSSTSEKPQNEEKTLKVGVIGMPNVGKSTLINALTGVHLLPVSKRIDTTRTNTIAVLTHQNVQIEFEDSPGIHNMLKTKKYKGKFSPAKLPADCMQSSDLCMVVVDCSSRRTSLGHLQPEILLHLITNRSVPAVLVLNKSDQLSQPDDSFDIIHGLTQGCLDGKETMVPKKLKKLKKINLPKFEANVIEAEGSWKDNKSLEKIDFAKKEKTILNQLRYIKGWPFFKEVFFVSAKKRSNVNLLKSFLIDSATPGQWKHDSEVITTAESEDILVDAMRAALLNNMTHEVPYETEVTLADFRETTDEIVVSFHLKCRKQRHLSYLQGNRKLLSFASQRRIQSLFNKQVNVDLIITCKAR